MLSEKLKKALNGEMTPKFLATASLDNIPNIVPVISMCNRKDEEIIFAEFMIRKTKKNILENPKVSICVIDENLNSWAIEGLFQRFEESGKNYNFISSQPFYRYNAYTGPKSVGVIKINNYNRLDSISKFSLIKNEYKKFFIKNTMNNMSIHRNVIDKFNRLKSVKVLTYLGDQGFPIIIPIANTKIVNNDLIFISQENIHLFRNISVNSKVAVSVITMEPISYQIKGIFKGWIRNDRGKIKITEAYNSNPPLPGAEIKLGIEQSLRE